jgi:hypothetical protein
MVRQILKSRTLNIETAGQVAKLFFVVFESFQSSLLETISLSTEVTTRRAIFVPIYKLCTLIRLVAEEKISLLLKIQLREHDYLSEHGCGSVRELRSHDHDDNKSGSTHRAKGEDVEIGIG